MLLCDETLDSIFMKTPRHVSNFWSIFSNGATAMCCAHFGQGNGSILLDDVDCLGTETDIEHCKHRGWGLHNCQHQEDVSVRCSPITGVTFYILIWNKQSITMSKKYRFYWFLDYLRYKSKWEPDYYYFFYNWYLFKMYAFAQR